MYEVRFKGRWSGPVAQALAGFETVEEGGETVVFLVDAPAFVALVNRVSELGLEIEGVARTPHHAEESWE